VILVYYCTCCCAAAARFYFVDEIKTWAARVIQHWSASFIAWKNGQNVWERCLKPLGRHPQSARKVGQAAGKIDKMVWEDFPINWNDPQK